MKDTLPPVWQASVKVRHSPAKSKTKLNQVWLVVQWLSVDVALGAICSSAMMCKLMNVTPLPWEQLFILGGTVQLIYTLDHLLDVRRMQTDPITERHLFHLQYKHQLYVFAAVSASILGVGAVSLLPSILLYFGIGLSALVALYLWLVNYLSGLKARNWFHKEICIAFLYTTGICGIPLLQAPHISIVEVLLVCCFCLIALQNLLLFSYYELVEDIRQEQRSVVQIWGVRRTKIILSYLFILSAAGVGLAYYISSEFVAKEVSVICGFMSATLALLFCVPAYFKKNYNYRKIGDGIFLMPGVVLLYEMLFF